MPRPLPRFLVVRVDDALRDDLKAAAATRGLSVSALIRPALRTAAARPDDRDPPPAAPAGTPPRLAA